MSICFCPYLKLNAKKSSYFLCDSRSFVYIYVILSKIRVTEENVPENEKNVGTEKQSAEEDTVDASKENVANEAEEKEPENKVVR